MSVINTENLYEAQVRKFSIGTNSRERFRASFLSAYNDTLFDLHTDGHISEPTMLTSVDDDSEVEEKFLPQIKQGIMHYLQSEGEWIKGESRDSYSMLNWERAKCRFQEVATQDLESSDTYTYPWGE